MFRVNRVLALAGLLTFVLAAQGCGEAKPLASGQGPAATQPADPVKSTELVEKTKDKEPDKTPEKAKPLSEADLVKLLELQPDEQVVLGRIEKQGLDFKVDDAARERLKKAGAPPAVLLALQGPKSATGSIMLWCAPQTKEWATPNLHSEISINGKVVEIFTSSKAKDVGGFLKHGWNTITMKTPAGAPYGEGNYLRFQFGPVHKGKGNEPVMSPVIWRFTNGLDWQDKGGKWTHQSDPDAKAVTLTFTVYLGHPELEREGGKKADYILHAAPNVVGATTPVSSTVTVNGTTFTSLLGVQRDIVITPLLKKGKNEVEIVTHRVSGVIYDWSSTIVVAGPGEWIATENEYQFKEIVKLRNLDGWIRDSKTGKWLNKENPEEETVKRVLTFNLDEAPTVK